MITKKLILTILTILFSTNSFAGREVKAALPGPEYIYLGMVTEERLMSCETIAASATQKFYNDQFVYPHNRKTIPNDTYLKRGGSDYGSQYYLEPEKIETVCSELTYILSSTPGGRRQNATYTAQLYCKPRNYSEIVVMSLFKSCVIKPDDKCFLPEIRLQLDSVKPLQSRYVWITACYKK